MPRIIVLDKLAQEGLDLLAAAKGIEYEVRTGLKGEELRAALAGADGAICRSGVKITADVLEGNRRLKAIARAGVGTDNIDKTAATRLGIVVMNTPTGNTLSTAEHAFALMLALSRNIAPAYQSLLEGRWDRSAYTGHSIGGQDARHRRAWDGSARRSLRGRLPSACASWVTIRFCRPSARWSWGSSRWRVSTKCCHVSIT